VKFDNILVSGCSWCYRPYDYSKPVGVRKTDIIGMTKTEAINLCFGKILSDKYNVDYKNIAGPGASNDLSFFEIVNNTLNNDLKNSLVILGITELSRFFVHHKKNRKVIKPKGASNSDVFKLSEENIKTFHEVKVSLTDEEMQLQEITMMCDLLQGFLKSRNSNLLVFNSFMDGIVLEGRDYYYDGFKSWARHIETYSDNYKFNRHPNAYDHKLLANDLYEYLNG